MNRSHSPLSQAALVALLVAMLGTAALMPGAGAAGGHLPATDHAASSVTGPLPGTVFSAPMQDAQDVAFNLSAVESVFGVETYKEDDRFNTRNPSDLENQTTNWANALGHRISFTVDVTGDEITVRCDDRFNAYAYVETLGGRLWGWTNGQFRTDVPTTDDICPSGLPGVAQYNVTFDLDGAPPTVQPEVAYPALGPGVYIATLELYHAENPSPSNPTGEGHLAGTYRIPFSIAEPRLALDQAFQRFPEDSLRLFSDVGSAPGFPDQFQMMPRPLARSENTTLTITFDGAPIGAPFERVDHVAVRTGVGLQLPSEPPTTVPPVDNLGDKLQNADDRLTVDVQRIPHTLSNDTVPPSRQVLMQVRGADFATATSPTTGAYVPLHVATIHLPATLDTLTTGVASFVAAVSDTTFPVRGLTVDGGAAGLTGSTRLTLRDDAQVAGGAAGTNAGDLFALADRGFGHEAITRTTLSRDTDSQWVRGSVPHSAFRGLQDTDDPVSRYTMLAMLYGPSDEFLGMTTVVRGIDIQLGALRTVEGQSDVVPLTVTNLGTDGDGVPGEADYAVTVRLASNANMPDGSAYNGSIENIPEGGSVTIDVPVAASRPGDFNVVFTATSGELTDRADTTIQVITKERAREEGRKWYEIPGPSASVPVLALLGLAALARRRT